MDERALIRTAFADGPEADAAMLGRARVRLRAAIAAEARPRSRRGLGILVAAVVTIALGGVAAAATVGLFNRYFTQSDLRALVKTVTQKVSDCKAPGDCGPPRTRRIREVVLLPAMSVQFVAAGGREFAVTPAANTASVTYPLDPSTAELRRSLRPTKNGTSAQVSLPGGGIRTISWAAGSGTVQVTDRLRDGATSTTTLHSGDVVPLIPGSLTDQPTTKDKAVTFDLPGGDYMVSIFPASNQITTTRGLPTRVARRYGLTRRTSGAYAPLTDRLGGSWSFRLDNQTTRTISWKAGSHYVEVIDRTSHGAVSAEAEVPTGREVELTSQGS